MRLHLKWAMQGGVCSDTDGSSSAVKPYPLRSKSHLQSSQVAALTVPKLIFLFFKPSFHQLVWSRRQKGKVHLTTDCNSKLNHSETSAPNPLVSQLVSSPLIFFESRKVFLEVGLKLLNAFPQPPSLIKDMAGFAPPSSFASAVVLFLSLSFSQSEGPCLEAESTFQMQTPLPLSLLLSVVSLRVFFSHRLACCACCVTYAPLPPGSTPSVLPRDRGPVVALWRGWEKSLEPHSKEKKSLSLWGGGVAPGHRGALWFFFFKFSHEEMGWKCWADVNVAGGLGGSRTCRWL